MDLAPTSQERFITAIRNKDLSTVYSLLFSEEVTPFIPGLVKIIPIEARLPTFFLLYLRCLIFDVEKPDYKSLVGDEMLQSVLGTCQSSQIRKFSRQFIEDRYQKIIVDGEGLNAVVYKLFVCVFGFPGSGKSSLNSLQLLSNTRKLEDFVSLPSGILSDQCTWFLGQVEPNRRITMTDLFGFADKNVEDCLNLSDELAFGDFSGYNIAPYSRKEIELAPANVILWVISAKDAPKNLEDYVPIKVLRRIREEIEVPVVVVMTHSESDPANKLYTLLCDILHKDLVIQIENTLKANGGGFTLQLAQKSVLIQKTLIEAFRQFPRHPDPSVAESMRRKLRLRRIWRNFSTRVGQAAIWLKANQASIAYWITFWVILVLAVYSVVLKT